VALGLVVIVLVVIVFFGSRAHDAAERGVTS
jgi:hypothetical protein